MASRTNHIKTMTELCKLEMAATNADELGNGWYDNNARVMESLLMRFTAMDPLCEKYPSISPYANSLCNPLRFSDPTGLDIYELDPDGKLKKDMKILTMINS